MSHKRKTGWAALSRSQKIFYIVSLLLIASMVLGTVARGHSRTHVADPHRQGAKPAELSERVHVDLLFSLRPPRLGGESLFLPSRPYRQTMKRPACDR